GLVAGSEAQVVVEPVRFYDFARIHFPFWVPNGFELPESLDQLRPKHFHEQFATSLAVTMLPRKRPSVIHDQICSFFHEFAKLGNALLRFEIEIDASMNTAVPEVSVKCSAVAITGHQLPQFAKIMAKLLGCDCRIFPPFPAQRLSRNVRDNS